VILYSENEYIKINYNLLLGIDDEERGIYDGDLV